MNEKYLQLLPFWKYADDCYSGIAEIKNPQKCTTYLKPFPSETNDAENKQYNLRCFYADYDNIFRAAIASMVGIMGKTPANVQFDKGDENVTPQEVKDIDIWGSQYDDRISGLKSRLNHAQTLQGRYGLLLDIVTNSAGLDPKFVIKEYNCYSILDGENFQSPVDGKERIKWVKLDESSLRFNPETKLREPFVRYRILGINRFNQYYSSVLEGQDADAMWRAFDFDNPVNAVYPLFKGVSLPFVPMTICNVDRIGINEWQMPPFIDMAYSTINAYNADSIYKQSLINHARPTLAVINAAIEGQLVLGSLLKIQSSNSMPADVKMIETSAAGIGEIGRSVKSIKEDAMRRTIYGMLDSVGANTSGTAISLRTAAGTATISSIDKAGARAIEEQLCFASVWAGSTWQEAGERISYTVDTSYMNNQGTIQEFVGLMGANQNQATGRSFLSKKNLYAIVEKLYPNTLTEYEDNELQLEDEVLKNPAPAPVLSMPENNTEELNG